jgi:flagellar hook-associated protein 1 FlgK
MALYNGTGMVGTGSTVTGVQRIRNEYLDFKYWSQNVNYGEWTVKHEQLSSLEAIFNEPSNSGFTTIMNNFYNSLQKLATDPSSAAVRALVKQNGITLSKYFNNLATKLEQMQQDINYTIQTKVEEVNSYATQIQQLNRQIYLYELDGSSANDLRDKRTLLVDKLSKIVNIEANEVVTGKLPDGREDKHFVVTLSGKALVDHVNVSLLTVEQRSSSEKVNDEDLENLYEVKWADGNSLNIKGGELKGYLDVRDGNEGEAGSNGIASPNYKGIPYYIKKLNEFARTFARAFNEGYIDADNDKAFDASEFSEVGHAAGYGYNSTKNGIRFFTMTGENNQAMTNDEFLGSAAAAVDPSDPNYNTYLESVYNAYNKVTAKNITVSADIINDFNLIATSDVAGESGNIDVLNSLIKLRQNDDMFSEGAPEDFMKSIITTMGVDAQQADNYSFNQMAIINQIVKNRISVSGVSLNEEMTNLVKFQQAYKASAKMIQTMGEVYDTLINRLLV